jgi:serine/threonine-protein kinase
MGQQQTPAPYGYVTPPPQSQNRDRSGSPIAFIVVGIVAVCGIAAAVLAASGVFSKESTPTSSTVASTTTSPTKTKGQGDEKKVKPKESQKVEPPAGSETCTGAKELWVNSVTSCPFAENTQSAYAEANGSKHLEVYSPVTGTTYAMTCKGTRLITCTGGNEAAVYFASAKASGQNTEPAPRVEPTPAPEPEYTGGGAATKACDQNISANEVTSCPFAENVFVAYWEEYEAIGESPVMYVVAYSEETGETYGMECYDYSDFIECTGGTEALVTFPLQAVREY